MKTLVIPLKEEEIRGLKLGETVCLTGEFYTARDEAHMRALEFLEEGEKLPVDFKDKAVFHCGPIMRKMNGEWELVAAGPTTSTRMNPLQPEFIEKLGPRAVIGKGGMGKDTLKAMEKCGCVYLAMTGGAAVLAAKGIKKVKGVEWLDLGMPEALWILVGENFGPLIVAMDAHGNSLFEDVDAQV
ncbi:MAG: fumarate hydratase C-terminal domain-containing protein, partial [Theionarchaea archaeon]|nr:fumarate hydratase C-terminal domain-containing protein [Theionarchaea archaeon]